MGTYKLLQKVMGNHVSMLLFLRKWLSHSMIGIIFQIDVAIGQLSSDLPNTSRPKDLGFFVSPILEIEPQILERRLAES